MKRRLSQTDPSRKLAKLDDLLTYTSFERARRSDTQKEIDLSTPVIQKFFKQATSHHANASRLESNENYIGAKQELDLASSCMEQAQQIMDNLNVSNNHPFAAALYERINNLSQLIQLSLPEYESDQSESEDEDESIAELIAAADVAEYTKLEFQEAKKAVKKAIKSKESAIKLERTAKAECDEALEAVKAAIAIAKAKTTALSAAKKAAEDASNAEKKSQNIAAEAKDAYECAAELALDLNADANQVDLYGSAEDIWDM
ncbi:hypothetical protein N9N97_03100 [Rickettsiaceae bacterium]|nr:hypothetical protein [Rickettsiaceae bacterium]